MTLVSAPGPRLSRGGLRGARGHTMLCTGADTWEESLAAESSWCVLVAEEEEAH